MTDVTDSAPRTGGPAALPVYLTAAALARTADEGARVALVMLAAQRADSPALGGALVAALMVPHVAAAPVAGALADAVRRRRLFHGGGVALYGVALAALAALVGRTGDLVVLALAAAAGCVAPLVTGGLTSLLGELLPKDRLTRAFSADAVSYNLAGICGPAAAALGTATSAALALAVLGAGATAGGLLLFSLRLRPRSGMRAREARPRPADLLSGAAVLVRDRPLRSVTWASSVGQLGVGALPVVSVLLARRYEAPWATGGLMTAFAVGALAGSLGYAYRPVGGERPERVVLWGLLGTAFPLAAVPWSWHVLVTTVLFAAAGFCTGPLFSALLASRERYAPAAVRTQVFTLGAGLKSTFAAAGAAAAGALSGLGAAPLSLGIAACQVAAAAVGRVLLTGRRTRGAARHPPRPGTLPPAPPAPPRTPPRTPRRKATREDPLRTPRRSPRHRSHHPMHRHDPSRRHARPSGRLPRSRGLPADGRAGARSAVPGSGARTAPRAGGHRGGRRLHRGRPHPGHGPAGLRGPGDRRGAGRLPHVRPRHRGHRDAAHRAHRRAPDRRPLRLHHLQPQPVPLHRTPAFSRPAGGSAGDLREPVRTSRPASDAAGGAAAPPGRPQHRADRGDPGTGPRRGTAHPSRRSRAVPLPGAGTGAPPTRRAPRGSWSTSASARSSSPSSCRWSARPSPDRSSVSSSPRASRASPGERSRSSRTTSSSRRRPG